MARLLARRFRFDRKWIPFQDGDTVGSALHRAGVRTISRSMKYHRPRGLYCCTGSCASCLVQIDGVPNLPACTASPNDGMQVESQNRIGSAKRDLLAATDYAFPLGFDPHGAFTRPRIINKLFLKAVRFMSGWGKVPSPTLVQESKPVRRRCHVDELIIGGGDGGQSRAQGTSKESNVLLIDEGKKLHVDVPDHVQAWDDALAFGIYDDVVAVRKGIDLWEITADRITLATGEHDDWPLFVGNDRPGVLSLKGATRLMQEHGVLPGKRVVSHGEPLPSEFEQKLTELGGVVVGQGQVAQAVGSPIRKAKIDNSWRRCDAIICNLPGVPRIELFQQAGCKLTWQNGRIIPQVDGDGKTTVPYIFAGGAK